MAVVINTNVDSIKIRGILSGSTNKVSQTMERMSSGLKVNSAKDDAAGIVISAKMQVQLSGNKIAQNNVQNGTAMLATAEGNINVIQDNLSRIRDLTLQAKNGTYSDDEIKAMQDEVDERIKEIDRISQVAKYSSLSLFEDTDMQADGVTFQVGADRDTHNTIDASSKIFASVKFSQITTITGGFDLKTLKAAENSDTTGLQGALKKLDEGITNLTDRKSQIGSAQNRLESALDTLTTQYENLSSANSIIMDADIAEEASTHTQQSILQQVSTSLLAQANQAPSVALSLV